jgi:DNA-binding NarL/FixJ family response regulator
MAKTNQFSVLLADDSLAMRTALRTLLEADTRFEVVGEASDGVEAVDKAGELRPNIILLDVTMPRLTGVEALPKVLQQSPHSTVVLLTAFSRETIEKSPAMELDSLRGVYYMDKTREGEELVNSLAGIASASLSTSLSPNGLASRNGQASRNGRSAKPDLRERTRSFIELMARNKRVAVAGIAAAVLAVGASVFAIGPATSAAGSCVTAKAPHWTGSSLIGGASHACGGKGEMYVFIQARHGNDKHVYTLASGSTTGTYLVTNVQPSCPVSGTWHAETIAVRGSKTNTSRVKTFSCQTNTPSLQLVR